MIKIEHMNYSPSVLELRIGEPIEFLNADLVPHAATASKPTGVFDSGPLQPGVFHPTMKGEVVVMERSEAMASPFGPRANGSDAVGPRPV